MTTDKRYKYPRTPHHPLSPGNTDDDKLMSKETLVKNFSNVEVVITEKMDGENTTMYKNHFHARSIDSNFHPSRSYVKRLWSEISYMIGDGERICGENVYARHSLAYDNLESYFLGFSYWDSDVCLSWDDTIAHFERLGIVPVKVLYRGLYSDAVVDDLIKTLDFEKTEGFVIRTVSSFKYNEFANSVCKYVRPNHVSTEKYWMHCDVVPNNLNGSKGVTYGH